MEAIKLEHVTKSFDDHKVLDDVSIDVEDGSAFCLLGRSGTGKSVTLKHIIGLLRPDAGHVFVRGKDVAALTGRELSDVRRSMGFLFQNAALFDSISWSILSSIVPRQTNLCTSTFLVCPIRKARSVAWFSTAGFHQRSKWMTCEAAVKLSPAPPALSESTKKGTSSSS